MGILRVGVVLAAVIVAAIAANVALLSLAGSDRDPVGKLSPVVAVTPSAVTPASTQPTRGKPVTPAPIVSDTSEETDEDD
jgi:hypothetical protein